MGCLNLVGEFGFEEFTVMVAEIESEEQPVALELDEPTSPSPFVPIDIPLAYLSYLAHFFYSFSIKLPPLPPIKL